jgi:hypothetical protein
VLVRALRTPPVVPVFTITDASTPAEATGAPY